MSSDLQDATLARLRGAAPGWTIWKGLHTKTWWACPPPGHTQRGLLNAGSLEELAEYLKAEAAR